MQLSIARMVNKRKTGEADLEPKDFPHVKAITKLFESAKRKAWAKINQDEDVQLLIAEEREYERRRYNSSQETIEAMINIRK